MDIWQFDDQRWQRSPGGGFELSGWRGMAVAAGLFEPHELAAWVGAHYGGELGDGRLCPGGFRYSPYTGSRLPEIPPARAETWLPPFGNGGGAACLGLRQTARILDLAVRDGPCAELSPPPPGEYHFLVGNFKTRRPLLLAVEPAHGAVYLHTANAWLECASRDGLLPASSLSAWGLCLHGENRLYWPTDEGLAVVDLNVLEAGYRMRLIPGRCLGGPVVLDNWLAVPAIGAAGRAGLRFLALDGDAEAGWLDCPEWAGGGDYAIPLVLRRQAFWLNQQGQACVGLDGARRLTVNALPWADGDSPRLVLGSAYFARNGTLWQLAYDDRSGCYHYAQLGRHRPERHLCRVPVLTAGTVCFARAGEWQGAPWADGGGTDDARAEDVRIPLLEDAGGSALCVRVAWVRGLDDLLASNTEHLARFEWVSRNGDVSLLSHKLPRPWLTRPFIYQDCLYLYHPEMASIPGWALTPAQNLS